MDPLMITALITQAMRVVADIQDRNAKGEVTDADVAVLVGVVKAHIAGFQALIDAHKA